MNANELADELEDWYNGNQINDTDPVPQAVAMLRQQQAEIEALKGEVAQLKHMNKNWSISEGWALQEIERLKVQYGICEDKP